MGARFPCSDSTTAGRYSQMTVPYFVSFNPAIPMEENLPAFMEVDDDIGRLLAGAEGVVLPAYVSPWRYAAITAWARNWFPRLDVRFAFGGKAKQTALFREKGVRHPETIVFSRPADVLICLDRSGGSPWGYPAVLKGDSGGGGSRVFPVYGRRDIEKHLDDLPGDEPVLLQRWVEHGGRDLRVVVYGEITVDYFRVGDGRFYNNICRGGRIERRLWPEDRSRGVDAVKSFCRQTGIDVAGFDLMFPDTGPPVFIEINFNFGRKGLGGSLGHRRYLLEAAGIWKTRCLRSIQPGSPGVD